MPTLRYIPLTGGAALKEVYGQQAEKHHDDELANDYSKSTTIPEPILDCIENPFSPADNYAADCDIRRKEDTCIHINKSKLEYNNASKEQEEGYLSDTILDQVLNCDYTSTSETNDHTVPPSSLDDKKRQNETSMPYEENEIDNRIGTQILFENNSLNHKRFKSHHAHHEQGEEKKQETSFSHPPTVPPTQYGMIPLSATSMSNTGSSHDGNNGQDALDEVLHSDSLELSSFETSDHSTVSSHPRCSFEKRFKHLEAYKAKHGHCNVKVRKAGDDKSLGMWCSKVRTALKKMKNNQAPIVAGLSKDNIQRLRNIGFDCNPKKKGRRHTFEKRFEELEAYKAKHGHCNTIPYVKSLGIWCSRVRRSVKKMKNNEAPVVAGLSEENIQRLEDIGFDCNPKK